MSEPLPIWKILARSHCIRSNPDCTHCATKQRCITAAKKAAANLIDQYFVVPRVGDSLSTIAALNRRDNQDISDIESRPCSTNPPGLSSPHPQPTAAAHEERTTDFNPSSEERTTDFNPSSANETNFVTKLEEITA